MYFCLKHYFLSNKWSEIGNKSEKTLKIILILTKLIEKTQNKSISDSFYDVFPKNTHF